MQSAAKNTPFLQKMSTPSYVIKTILFYAFCVRGCVASHVESDPHPGFLAHFVAKSGPFVGRFGGALHTWLQACYYFHTFHFEKNNVQLVVVEAFFLVFLKAIIQSKIKKYRL